MEQGQRAADGGDHGCDPDRASGRRQLSDLQRGQLRFCPDSRLCPEELDYAERLHLYPPASVDLRDLSDARCRYPASLLSDVVTEAARVKWKGRAMGAA